MRGEGGAQNGRDECVWGRREEAPEMACDVTRGLVGIGEPRGV